jgi:tetratricopeptide (TPR) repeat protein
VVGFDAKISFLSGHRPNSHIDVANIQTAPKIIHQERAGGISMKTLLSSRGLFAIGFMILAATNIVVLSGVASNRSGIPETQITLTERELKLPYRAYEENSGLTLRFAWRALGKDANYNKNPDWRSPAWFSAEKLEELGFNINNNLSSKENATYYKQPIPKEVFIVFENNGEPYREALRRAEMVLEKEESLFKLNSGDKRLRDNFEKAEKRLKRERITESRLFAIDAGLDPNILREKYGDRTHFIIAKGLVKPRYHQNRKRKEVHGYITNLSVGSIHVPLEYREVFDTILAQDKPKKNEFQSPRYELELAYGSRFEPWIVSVHPLGDNSKNQVEPLFEVGSRRLGVLDDKPKSNHVAAKPIYKSSKEAYKKSFANFTKGYYNQAMEGFNQAIRLDPNDAKAYYGRGITYRKLGKYKKAKEDYDQAIRLNPKFASAYQGRGTAYYKLGKKDSACDDWRKACELGSCIGLNWGKEQGYCH